MALEKKRYLDDGDAHVRIVDTLDAVANAHDELAFFAHGVDKLHGMLASVVGLAELTCSCVQCTSETIALWSPNPLKNLSGTQSRLTKPGISLCE